MSAGLKPGRGLSPTRDCLALLPGWEASKGAVEERALALEPKVLISVLILLVTVFEA